MNQRSDKSILLITFVKLHDICRSPSQVGHASRMAGKRPSSPLQKIREHPDCRHETSLELSMCFQKLVVMLVRSILQLRTEFTQLFHQRPITLFEANIFLA